MHFTTDIYRVFQLKNSHYCFLHYLLGKWSNLYKNFSKCSWVNSDYSYIKIIEPRINILWYQWHSSDVMYCLFCNSGIYCWRHIFASANTENIEGLALSQEEKPQTHSGKVHDLYHNYLWLTLQECRAWSVTEVYVGLLQVPTTWLLLDSASANNFLSQRF